MKDTTSWRPYRTHTSFGRLRLSPLSQFSRLGLCPSFITLPDLRLITWWHKPPPDIDRPTMSLDTPLACRIIGPTTLSKVGYGYGFEGRIQETCPSHTLLIRSISCPFFIWSRIRARIASRYPVPSSGANCSQIQKNENGSFDSLLNHFTAV